MPRRLLADAGYPNGIEASSGKPLVIYFDGTLVGAEGKSRADWLVKHLAKIKLQLVVRNTDFNRSRKSAQGHGAMFFFGWNADYPDPENFLFMFHGPQTARSKRENSANM